MSKPYTEEAFAAGCEMMDKVYGKGSMPELKLGTSAYVDETVCHLFADIWSRPGLSLRERRLLIIGATATMGRADLIEIQMRGALENGELCDAELEEILLHLSFYVGWPNSTAVLRGIQSALLAQKPATP